MSIQTSASIPTHASVSLTRILPFRGMALHARWSGGEPEILLPYGDTRFGANSGELLGNPVLTIVDRLAELAHAGRAILETGARSFSIQLADGA